jgi:hypothetical protein
MDMNMTNQQMGANRRAVWLLLTPFIGVGFGLCAGLAAYHFHLLHAIQARHAEQQVMFGLNLVVCATIALVVVAVARRVRKSA